MTRGKKTRGKKVKIHDSNGMRRPVPPYFYYALLFLVIVFFALLRFRLRAMPLERDEGEYAYAGQLMLQGIPPYQLAYNMKVPGTYAAYAAILATFGQTSAGVRTGLILVNAATTLLVFLLARRLFGWLAGLIAGSSYALLSTSPSVLGFHSHATHFVVLFAIAGILVLLQALESDRIWLFFASGLLLGLAFLMKQPGLAFLLFALVYTIGRMWKPPANWQRLAASSGSLALGGALPFAITCLMMAGAGLFHKFWFWTFVYARQYGTNLKLTEGLELLKAVVPQVIGPALWIWAIAAVGLTAFLWSTRARAHAFFKISFLLVSFLAVCPGLYFRPHYFILILPAISILAGIAVSCASVKLLDWRGRRILSAIPALLFLVAFSCSIFQQREFLFQMDPLEACDAIYGREPFPEAIQIADYIRSHTPEDATVAVLGSEPEIYFYSHRHSATGYIYAYPLLERQKYALDMQKEMMAEIEKARPAVLVLVNLPDSWIASSSIASTKDILSWAQRYIHEHYVVDGVAELGNFTTYRWGEEAKSYQPHVPLTIFVFKRTSP